MSAWNSSHNDITTIGSTDNIKYRASKQHIIPYKQPRPLNKTLSLHTTCVPCHRYTDD